MQVVAVMNYKGGVGKTTLTANLGAEIASRGHRVLLVDLDPQANLTFSFYSIDEFHESLADDKTIMQWYLGDMPGRKANLADLVVTPEPVNRRFGDGDGQLDLIASHLGLIDIDLELAAKLGGTTIGESKRKFLELHGCLLKALKGPDFAQYDLVLIDCAPNFGLVTKTAIVASDHILVPAKADYLSTLGIEYLVGNCQKLVKDFNDYVEHGFSADSGFVAIRPQFAGVVFTMIQVYANKPIGTQLNYVEEVRMNASVPVLDGVVRNSPRHFGDAGSTGVPAMLRAALDDEVAAEFRDLAEEIITTITRQRSAAG
ncbi:ParA family protein [Dactylosporangium maewongense]